MPPFNWDSLDDWSDWKAKLQELLRRGRAALEQSAPGPLTQAETDLQEFIGHDVAYDDLRSEAKAALGELLTADIQGIIKRIEALSQQLPTLRPESFITRQQLPHWRVAHALSAVAALREQHRTAPYAHPRLEQQLTELLGTLQELLGERPAAPRASSRGKQAAKPRQAPKK